MKTIKIKLKQKNRVCFSRVRNIQNVFYTSDYIPGTALLGFYIRNRGNGIELEDFFNGNIRFHNGYKMFGDNQSIPVPFSFHQCKKQPLVIDKPKDKQHTFIDVRGDKKHSCKECKGDKGELRRINSGYYYNSGIGTLDKIVEMHNHIDKKRQSTKDEGGLFSYEFLEEQGSVYCCYIEIDETEPGLYNNMLELIKRKSNLTLGKSYTSGFGEFTIEGNPEELNDTPLSSEFSCFTKSIEGNSFQIYCLSDIILQDEFGFYNTTLLPKNIGLENVIELKKTFSEKAVIYGWINVFNMARITDYAIKKGSCFEYFIKDGATIDSIKEKLNNIARDGIGLRTHEGFGRILVNMKRASIDDFDFTKKPEKTIKTKDNNKLNSIKQWNKLDFTKCPSVSSLYNTLNTEFNDSNDDKNAIINLLSTIIKQKDRPKGESWRSNIIKNREKKPQEFYNFLIEELKKSLDIDKENKIKDDSKRNLNNWLNNFKEYYRVVKLLDN